ncbi:hypothetical protein AAGF08_10465 [Algoriphagus sp. SE2]|uniref:hypothetical protein n=1 Tax=Algoriphagus sp. SE2 TaxID=3141536 RepID=UPI0031CCF95F
MRSFYKNSLATVSLFLLLALIPISCDLVCTDSCGCGSKTQISDFKIISLEMLTVNTDGEELNPEIPQPYKQILKTLKIKDIEIVSAIESSNFGLPGVAYACSPIPPKSQERLEDLKLFNLKEVELGDGTVLKPGDLLNDFFEINYFSASDTKPIQEFVSENIIIYLDDYYKLSFIKDPGKEVVIEFSMQLIFENGRTISVNNEKLSIK